MKLQDWVVQSRHKLVILFEGRDAAGKGGVIKRITQRLNPRICRVAGVERVMGFCSDEQYEQFFDDVPEFEKMLVRSGIQLLKYWFSITDEEQELRFKARIHDPLKQWKLSPMDLESRRRWEQYTKAKEIMLERTHIAEARWFVVQAVEKKKARLNCIHHLLRQVPYGEVQHPEIVLPSRERHGGYRRSPTPADLMVPEVY